MLSADGARLRDVINDLERQFPGIAARLVESGRLAAGIAVAIDGEIASMGLLSPVGAASEIHFLPAVGGG
jgi:molybdopterin synthase sulfur carrier subunit